MKQIIFTGLFITIFFSAGIGQHKIEVKETSYGFSTGKQYALYVTVFEAKPKDVAKAWQKRLRDFKGKNSEKKGEIFSDNAIIRDFNDNNAVDIYSNFKETKDGNTDMYVAVNLGGAYLSSSEHPEKYKVMKKILYDFAKKMSQDIVHQQIKDAEKLLAGLKSEQKKLIGKNENLRKNIADYKEKIKKCESDIKENLLNQEAKKKEIEAQHKIVDALNQKLKAIK